MKKIIRITTVPQSLSGLLKGQLNFMKNHYEILGVSSNLGYDNILNDYSEEEGIQVKAIEMTRKITPFKDLKAVWELYKLFKTEKPFIVHTHTPKAGTLGMIASKMANVPHRMHTIAGLPLVEINGLKRKLLNFVEKITYACATKIYPNSYGLVDIILDNNFTNMEKLKVIGNGSSNGIDTAHFDANQISAEKKESLKKESGIKPTDIVFIFVGRLVSDKGINELIKAFESINNEFNNTKLLIVGSYEADIDPVHKTTIETIENHKDIITMGWQSDVRPFLAISNILVFPSYREGFPNVVMQAAAMKLPCIVTDINGCNEIINEGENGIIIPVKNTDAIYKAMKKMILMDPKEIKLIGENARKIIVSKYERQFIWDELLKEYKSLELE